MVVQLPRVAPEAPLPHADPPVNLVQQVWGFNDGDSSQFFAARRLSAVVRTTEVFIPNLGRSSEADQANVILTPLLDAAQKGRERGSFGKDKRPYFILVKDSGLLVLTTVHYNSVK